MMISLKSLTCYVCQRQMDAFLDGTLAPRARRRLAGHIDECPACYRVYVERRELQRDLQQALPLVGQRDHKPDFDRMWGAIRAELPQPPSQRPFRFGLVALMLLLALVVPFTMGNRDLARALPDQPRPQLETVAKTPTGSQPVASATLVAATSHDSNFVFAIPPTQPQPGR